MNGPTVAPRRPLRFSEAKICPVQTCERKTTRFQEKGRAVKRAPSRLCLYFIRSNFIRSNFSN